VGDFHLLPRQLNAWVAIQVTLLVCQVHLLVIHVSLGDLQQLQIPKIAWRVNQAKFRMLQVYRLVLIVILENLVLEEHLALTVRLVTLHQKYLPQHVQLVPPGNFQIVQVVVLASIVLLENLLK
jgi:hypothetical protein